MAPGPKHIGPAFTFILTDLGEVVAHAKAQFSQLIRIQAAIQGSFAGPRRDAGIRRCPLGLFHKDLDYAAYSITAIKGGGCPAEHFDAVHIMKVDAPQFVAIDCFRCVFTG